MVLFCKWCPRSRRHNYTQLMEMTGTLKAGDYIKFASHNKVYMVVADVTADGSNEATLTIEPPLITALADDSAVTYDNVPFTVHLTSDIQEFGGCRFR